MKLEFSWEIALISLVFSIGDSFVGRYFRMCVIFSWLIMLTKQAGLL